MPAPFAASALLVALAGSVGCDRPSTVSAESAPTGAREASGVSIDVDAVAGARSGTAGARTVAYADVDAVASDGHVEATLDPGDVSLLLTFVLEHPEDGIGITRVTAPDGTPLHDTTFASDSWEATAFASTVATEPLTGAGELALFLPASPSTPLVPGVYRVAFETDPADAGLARVERTIKRAPGREGDDDVPFDRRPQRIDVHVHVLHPDPDFRGARFARSVDVDWRAALDDMLAPHALGIGTVTVTVAAEAVSTRLAELDDEIEITAACHSARRALPGASRTAPAAAPAAAPASGESTGTPARASTEANPPRPPLHVAFVAEIVDAEGEDWLTGLAPQPGSPFDDTSPNGCVFIGERAWTADRLDPDTVVELLAANLLHELGHFAGLAHPSEVDGTTFDLLDDTPRCTVPDPLDCGAAGGAGNVMFHSGDADTLPWTLSADQAWVLRRHPLFR